jgi:hypothetical protein
LYLSKNLLILLERKEERIIYFSSLLPQANG